MGLMCSCSFNKTAAHVTTGEVEEVEEVEGGVLVVRMHYFPSPTITPLYQGEQYLHHHVYSCSGGWWWWWLCLLLLWVVAAVMVVVVSEVVEKVAMGSKVVVADMVVELVVAAVMVVMIIGYNTPLQVLHYSAHHTKLSCTVVVLFTC